MMNEDREYTLKVRDMEITVTKKKFIKLLLGAVFVIGNYVILTTLSTVLPLGLLILQSVVTLLVMVIIILKMWELVDFEEEETNE